MTGSPDPTRPPPAPSPPRRYGLALRVWLAVLAAPIVVAIGIGAAIRVFWLGGITPAPREIALGLGGIAVAGLIVALAAASWLASGLTRALRRIDAGITAGHLAEPQSAPTPRWGEIGPLTDGVRELLERQRRLARAEAELREVQTAIANAYAHVDRWQRTERWSPIGPVTGHFGALANAIDHGFARLAEVGRQSLKAADLVRGDATRVLEDARAAAELAERGYVDATALMTTVREIVRLATEIRQVADAPPEPAAPPAQPPPAPAAELAEAPIASDWQERAAEALEDLVGESAESVDHLGRGLSAVHEISDAVQLLANRATLIALQALAAGAEPARAETATELKQLAIDVRTATDRVAELSAAVDHDVRAAGERMHAARERVLARLEALPAAPDPVAAAPPPPPVPPAPPIAAPPALLVQWIERLREMAQDATRKGERLTESQENASGAASRVVRALDEQAQDLEGLVVRLTPAGAASLESTESPAESTRRLTVVHPSPPVEPGASAAGPGAPR